MSPSKTTADETSTAFKHLINEAVFLRWAKTLETLEPRFERKLFLANLKSELASRELKDRIRFLGQRLWEALPLSFTAKADLMVEAFRTEPALHGFAGSGAHEMVAVYGRASKKEFAHSLKVLKKITPAFSSEFAVQPFLAQDLTGTLCFLQSLVNNPDVHVRRWASEGSRPRLPWGIRLRAIQANPDLTLPILRALRYDSELYVRKSVANHLNDLSKDHPERIVRELATWKKSAPVEHREKIAWIARHALRSLIKQGDPSVLALFGWNGKVSLARKQLKLSRNTVAIGERLEFAVHLQSRESRSAALDFRVYYRKKDGKLSPKVFKWKTLELKKGTSVSLTKNHSFKPVTIRTVYPGAHALGIQLNGFEILRTEFTVTAATRASRSAAFSQ